MIVMQEGCGFLGFRLRNVPSKTTIIFLLLLSVHGYFICLRDLLIIIVV